jgi:hypothetical protein
MSPEARASLAVLARLRREIRSDRDAAGRCLGDAREVVAGWGDAPPARPLLVLAAAALHAWYTGVEAVLDRIARALDGSVPAGERWHRDLLSQAMTELPGIRPAVLPRTLHLALLQLLEFRHFFRHGYGLELDPARLRANLDRLLAVASEVEAALDAFDRFLAQAEQEVAAEPDGR